MYNYESYHYCSDLISFYIWLQLAPLSLNHSLTGNSYRTSITIIQALSQLPPSELWLLFSFLKCKHVLISKAGTDFQAQKNLIIASKY